MINRNKIKISLLSFTALMSFFSCQKEADFTNSPDDMILESTEYIRNFSEQTFEVPFKTDKDWIIEDIYATPKQEEGEEWITVDQMSGNGSGKVNISLSENNTISTRNAIVRFRVHPLYPEYRSVTIYQTGIPETHIQSIENVTETSITLKGDYKYDGEETVVVKQGFMINVNGEEKPLKVYADMSSEESEEEEDNKHKDNSFSCVYPVEAGKEYEIRAFTEDAAGNVWTSEESKKIGIKFSIGELTFEGNIRSNSVIKDTKLKLSYYFGDDQTYVISATSDVSGINISEQEVVLSSEGGIIELPITGTVETTGTVKFTITGLPEAIEEVYSIEVEILPGGMHQLIFHENFGIGYTFDASKNKGKGYDPSTKPAEGQPFTDTNIKLLRLGQPNVEYYMSGTMTFRIDSEGFTAFAGASGGVFINVQKGGTKGDLKIMHLSSLKADNLEIELLGKNIFKNEELAVYYSTAEEPENWQKLDSDIPGTGDDIFKLIIKGLPASEDFNLKIEMTSSSGDKKGRMIDDVKIYGDFI